MFALKNILVATDFSQSSAAALNYGRELARNFGGQLVLLHVVENMFTAEVGADVFSFADPGLQASVRAAGQRGVDELLGPEDRIQLRAQGVVLTSNTPALAIVEYAKRGDVNLIVMGTHGRGGTAHLLLGSVAERVVRIAPCPVLTVRHPEREFVLPDALVAVTKSGTVERVAAPLVCQEG